MNSSIIKRILAMEKPSCFEDERSYNLSAPTCRACSYNDSCASGIEMHHFLDDLPDAEPCAGGAIEAPSIGSGAILESARAFESSNAAALGPAVSFESAAPYVFPAKNFRHYSHYSNNDLIAEVERLIKLADLMSAATQYESVRGAMCALHIEMNLRQQHAPRFRPQSPLPKKADSHAAALLGLDRQVIDLHWRAHSCDKPMVQVDDFPGIFDSEPFDFELAARFAQLGWKSATKAVHLHLTNDMQWEHAILQSSNIRDKWRTIRSGDLRGSVVKEIGAPQVYTALHQSMASTPHLRAHIPGLVQIWSARRIVGESPQRVARLVALMCGERARDASAIRRSIMSLDKHLGFIRGTKKVGK